MEYQLDIGAVTRNLGPLLDGLWVTLQLTLAANVIGIVAGFALALLTTSKLAILRLPSMLFVEFFRCTPAIVQIIWFFYCVPILFNVFWGPIFMGIIYFGLFLVTDLLRRAMGKNAMDSKEHNGSFWSTREVRRANLERQF